MNDHPSWRTLKEDEGQAWQTLSSRQLVTGIRPITEDQVRTPGGTEFTYQYRQRGPRAVFILPVTSEGQLVLIRQYRYPLRATITEIVAGGVEPGEDIGRAAERELLEEVGGTAQEWVPLPGFYPQPSISGVVFYAYLALGVTLGEAHLEPTETIERFTVSVPEAYRMLAAGEIQDGSSALTLWQAQARLRERGFL
ncbi:NUDIX domain-containing protein [Deinococcus fonticola]|uniref:NUDIX domain-containing protein n=1 Tax=Deinococcus fonticola TaxID=2528713 RepID=UPI0010756F26|nr:NUDIX hydrolase [Deinococcus fonticola]